jgi:hypothetical protein
MITQYKKIKKKFSCKNNLILKDKIKKDEKETLEKTWVTRINLLHGSSDRKNLIEKKNKKITTIIK